MHLRHKHFDVSHLFTPLPQEISYDKSKVSLGKKLFEDPGLSKNGDIACLNCHFNYGADTRQFSMGDANQLGVINTPSIYNLGYNIALTWNGRAKSLSEQMIDPLTVKHEMANNKQQIEAYLENIPQYRDLFKKNYASTPSFNLMIDAIVAFEKTLISPNAKFDRFLRKEVKLSEQEQRGLDSFVNFGCVNCHNGINIGGNSYQTFGKVIPFNEHYESQSIMDSDRYSVTKSEFDHHVFRVPSLRNIAKTAPYFHFGGVPELKEAIKLMAKHNLGMNLNANEVADIEAFLHTLTGELPQTIREAIK